MKLVAFETEAWEAEACRVLQPEFDFSCTVRPLDEASVAAYQDADLVTVFVHSRLTVPVLVQLPNLKLIVTRSTGYDHIDLDYCAKAGIAVANVPDYGDSTVAEHVFALLLAIARNLVEAVERTRHGNFSQTGLRGFELRGKTLGVIGTGRIGCRAIEIARGFGMPVIAYDAVPDEEAAARLEFRYGELDQIFTEADVLTLHVPATPQTAGMVGDREFELMKPGALLINTARGNIVDVPALVRALTSGRLRAAGLDVLPQEPLIREEAEIFRADAHADDHDLKALVANHVLLRFPNVIVTPHNAYNTESAVRRIIDTTVRNIEAFAADRPENIVTRR